MMKKQIEGMAKDMLEASISANVEPVLEVDGKEVVLGENATKILNNILEQAFIPFLAEILTAKGYRKASEVAREIFAEIDRVFDEQFASAKARHRTKDVYAWCETDGEITAITEARMLIAELKKKYTEEGK